VSSPFFALQAIELSGAYLIAETLMGISKKETQIDVECSGPHAPAGLEGATFHCLEPGGPCTQFNIDVYLYQQTILINEALK
jgi:hypothetical protein